MQAGRKLGHENPIYKGIRLPSYTLMLTLARDNIRSGKSALIDAPHIKEMKMGKGYFEGVAQKIIGVPYGLKAILCYAPKDVIFERMVGKNDSRDDYMFKWADFEKDLEREEIIPPEIENFNHIKIDTSQDNEANIRKTLEFLAM